MVKIAPSLLAADLSRLGDAVRQIEVAGVEYLHLDIMDGHFVPNITYGPGMVRALRPLSNLLFDAHLMIQNPDAFIPAFADAGADIITVHVETTPHLHRTLQFIREKGAKPAVALNPATPLETVNFVLDQVEMVLIMTVNPGFGGQAFLPFVVEKIRQLKCLIDNRGLKVDIQVDGGITPATAPLAVKAGAKVLVAGSAIFGFPDVKKAVEDLRSSSTLS
ncbi:MAG: ribulose-phosphate 3-epimerase [Syntrophomonadaceae bacterium]|nr:ribulose-phosphate 3-epimerase [Syntrophomonadaceae bacterium]